MCTKCALSPEWRKSLGDTVPKLTIGVSFTRDRSQVQSLPRPPPSPIRDLNVRFAPLQHCAEHAKSKGLFAPTAQPTDESNAGDGIKSIGGGIIDRVREYQRSDAKTKAPDQGQLSPGERIALTRPIPGRQLRCRRVIRLRQDRRREGAALGRQRRAVLGGSCASEGRGRTWHRASLPSGRFLKAYRSIGSIGSRNAR